MFAEIAENNVTSIPPLRDLGESRGILMGSALNMWHVQLDERYDENFKREYAIATAESDCKWGVIRPSQGVFNLDRCVDHFKYAIDNGMQFRGHNLCWTNYNPNWLKWFKGSASELDKVLEEHITKVMQGVREKAGGHKILAWDVVNEAVSDSNSGDILKHADPWYPKLPDYIDRAFRYARKADPDALLFYNDYGPSYSS